MELKTHIGQPSFGHNLGTEILGIDQGQNLRKFDLVADLGFSPDLRNLHCGHWTWPPTIHQYNHLSKQPNVCPVNSVQWVVSIVSNIPAISTSGNKARQHPFPDLITLYLYYLRRWVRCLAMAGQCGGNTGQWKEARCAMATQWLCMYPNVA